MDNVIQLSSITRKSLEIDVNKEITEEELKKICEEYMDLSINITELTVHIAEQDEELISKYMDSREIDIRID